MAHLYAQDGMPQPDAFILTTMGCSKATMAVDGDTVKDKSTGAFHTSGVSGMRGSNATIYVCVHA